VASNLEDDGTTGEINRVIAGLTDDHAFTVDNRT
jgi:hypothetical protein